LYPRTNYRGNVETNHRLRAGHVAHGHIGVTLERFLADVAERTPAPGGGAGAGVGCALGAALTEMAARFAGMDDAVARAAALRERGLALAQADRSVYLPVLEALRLPASDPGRAEALRAAQSAAADVPLAIAEAAAEVAGLAREVAAAGKSGLRGDALAGADIAAGAARAAARLVEINLAGVADDPRVARARAAAAGASNGGH
jgi:methenyltetrahydrofolate cyclohydrolase